MTDCWEHQQIENHRLYTVCLPVICIIFESCISLISNRQVCLVTYHIIQCVPFIAAQQPLLTHSIQHSPSWEANRFAASQEIPHSFWNPKVHYRSHNCPPPVSVLSQLDPVHTPTSHFLTIHLIIPSTPGSTKWLLSSRFLHQNPIYTIHLSSPPYAVHHCSL
jgi:hypothetical protein